MSALRRLVVPSSWAWEHQRSRGNRDSYEGDTDIGIEDEDDADRGGLFDAESGEAMVGFTGSRVQRGRDNGNGEDVAFDDSNRRLSRDLEEGFRDDSGSEASDEEVTVGRRTISRRASEVRS